jgi:NAD-dependent deacetylase
MERLVKVIKESKYTVAFTGAGVSTFSGIKDFRGKDGLYKSENSNKIFDIAWFYKDPSIYYTASKDFIYNLGDIKPSIVHNELARLEEKGLLNAVITQNIDILHQKAGSKKVYELHGSLNPHECPKCKEKITFEEAAKIVNAGKLPLCTKCKTVLKPNIVFFGEMLPAKAFEGAVHEAEKAELLIVLGSTLVVQPAASIPLYTIKNGGKVVIINNMETSLDRNAYLKYNDLESVFRFIAENI